MENLKCKVCGSSDIIKVDGIFECRICGSQELVDSDANSITQHQVFSKNKVIEIIEDARKLHGAGKYREELKLLHNAIETDGNHSILYVSLGRLYRTIGLIEEAIECYDTAIELNSYEGMAYTNLGAIHLMRENYEEAAECYEIGLRYTDKANGDYWVAYANYAIAVAKLGNPTKAKLMIFEAEAHGYKNAESARKLAGLVKENSLSSKINSIFYKKR